LFATYIEVEVEEEEYEKFHQVKHKQKKTGRDSRFNTLDRSGLENILGKKKFNVNESIPSIDNEAHNFSNRFKQPTVAADNE